MAISLDGKEYTIQSATDNALDLLNYINNYCAENDIKNIRGKVIQLEVNLTSPIWLIIFALGFVINVVQRAIYAVGCNFNISTASNKQILALAEIGKLQRLRGSVTTIQAHITATAEGPCEITSDLEATVTLSGSDIVFKPLFNIVIEAEQTGIVVLGADRIGPLYIPANTITEFDTAVANLAHIHTMNSVAGTNVETISHLRGRLQYNNQGTEVDRCINELHNLPGIVSANVFINISNVDPIVIGNHTVGPRRTIIFIQGFSEQIASTYYSNMSIETTNGDGAVSQMYTTLSGQELPVYFFPPIIKDFFVRMTIDAIVTEAITLQLKEQMFQLNGLKSIGQQYSLRDAYSILQNQQYTYEVVGVEISMDGSNWGFVTALGPDEFGNLPLDNILIRSDQ